MFVYQERTREKEREWEILAAVGSQRLRAAGFEIVDDSYNKLL